LRMDNLLAGKSDPPCLKQDQVSLVLSSAARWMKNPSQNNSGHVNNVSGPGPLFIHFPLESVFTSPRNLYSHHSGTLIHIARNTHAAVLGARVP
jgi:hypothetical protein